MHHLGVPSTRALCLVDTGEPVVRDMFYDGNPRQEPGAIVCRVAPSFTRFGNFEILASRGENELLRRLVDYTIRTSFPHLGEPSPERDRRWFEEVCTTTARMILGWLRVGFVHGVMNTDNMSVLGATIDYGPYGWLENFDPDWTPNTTDAGGRRYRFGNQPQIALWNLLRLAEALSVIVDEADLEPGLRTYGREIETGSQSMMAAKLGLASFHPGTDGELVTELNGVLTMVETDMTLFYRRLSRVSGLAGDAELVDAFADAYYRPEELTAEYRARLGAWVRRYLERALADGLAPAERRARMDAVNPLYVLRNYLAQLAIDKAEQGDGSLVEELLEVLRRPYTEQPGKDDFARRRPEWARHRAGCSMLSCSS
jgi:uncharacterized protein YdiU (UPF0061 family)